MAWFRRTRQRLLLVLLLLASLLLYSQSLRQKEYTTLFQRVVLQICGPALQGMDWVTHSLGSAWQQYVWLVHTQKRNTQLEQINDQLQARLRHFQELEKENKRLRELLAFSRSTRWESRAARVVGENIKDFRHTLLLDKGSRQGLRRGLPVMVADGVVGRIWRCSPQHSHVLLITDPASRVATLVQRTRTRGVVRGQGQDRLLQLDYALRRQEIRPGDVVLTSGTGQIFPKGLLVGRIEKVRKPDYGLFQYPQVAPSVDFSRLEEVLVLFPRKGAQ